MPVVPVCWAPTLPRGGGRRSALDFPPLAHLPGEANSDTFVPDPCGEQVDNDVEIPTLILHLAATKRCWPVAVMTTRSLPEKLIVWR
jgi:hypothetical protein